MEFAIKYLTTWQLEITKIVAKTSPQQEHMYSKNNNIILAIVSSCVDNCLKICVHILNQKTFCD